MSEKLAILDCGGQYTKVIDRKVRELGVYTDIFPMGVNSERLKGYQAIILSGGPASVWADAAPKYDESIFDLGIPMLGICYGMQLICEHFGGKVLPEVKTEYGQIEITVDTSCPMFDKLEKKQKVLMSHGDAVSELAPGFCTVAETGKVVAGIYNAPLRIVGVQFHPEVDLSENGIAMLNNFLRKICSFTEEYEPSDLIETSVKMIRDRVGDRNVMVLVSGGVDSAVTAALLLKALKPEQIYAIHVDHGLMRKNESDIICENLKTLGLKNLKRVNAMNTFFNEKIDIGDGKILGPLSKTCDPEQKRQIIGSMFIKVTRDAADEFGLDFDTTFLAQGTLRPDLIESGNPDVSGYAHKIKTHHNDVDLVRRAREKGLIIETNWDWHKDEVRRIARILGLSEDVASRQPFPGPGLGVRILCSDGKMDIDEDLAHSLTDFIQKENYAYGCAIAPVQSVGVQGDNRSYKSLALLSQKEDSDNFERIFELAKALPNHFSKINRVAYLISGRDFDGKIKNTAMYIGKDTADLLREADHIVTNCIMNSNISQCFAVLIPIGIHKKYSIAIRAVVTSDFMTARPALPGKDFSLEALQKASTQILDQCADVDMVFYDVTGKPPATVEWE